VLGVALFREPATAARLACIGLIVAGSSAEAADALAVLHPTARAGAGGASADGVGPAA
jgi:hypothetical protein